MTVRITVDGEPVEAPAGSSLTAAFVGTRRWRLRDHPISGEPRGPFCGMGVCFECEVTVDGRPGVRACLERVAPGMTVETGR
ncbi:(2Fe-2S)-binding protein [Spirillospora sp. NPDC047279]|uniref:(2Fe-2S)-binding protein n=1 Tax=Spirillospora sp. NPDC047279 TaxID=3155478 RepID=UPI0033F134E7